MTGRWVPPDRRDVVVHCVASLSTRTELAVRPILQRLGLARAKFARWTASIDVHDARCPRRRGEFYIGLSRAQSGGAAGSLNAPRRRVGFKAGCSYLSDPTQTRALPFNVSCDLRIAARRLCVHCPRNFTLLPLLK